MADDAATPHDPAHDERSLTGGWVGTLGFEVTEAGGDAAAVAWPATFGTTEAYLAAVETTCSIGAALWWAGEREGGRAVGMSNHTTVFDLDARGPFVARATPLDRGTVQQLWRCEVRDGDGTPCASGEVLMANLS